MSLRSAAKGGGFWAGLVDFTLGGYTCSRPQAVRTVSYCIVVSEAVCAADPRVAGGKPLSQGQEDDRVEINPDGFLAPEHDPSEAAQGGERRESLHIHSLEQEPTAVGSWAV